MDNRTATIAALAASAACMIPLEASACSCDHPIVHELIVGGTIPVDAGFSIWHRAQYAGTGGPDTLAPEVTAVLPDGSMTTTVVTRADDELWTVSLPDAEVGDFLEVTSTPPEYDVGTDPGPETVSLTIAPRPQVESPFELSTTPLVIETKRVSSDECSSDQEIAYIDIVADLDPELAKFSDALLTELSVDGGPAPVFKTSYCTELPPSSSELGHNRYRLWTECGHEISGLPAGTYDVQMRAWLPDTDLEWTSSTTTVRLDCGDGEPDGSGPDIGVLEDAGAPSTDGTPGDSGPLPDAARRAGDDDRGCSTTGGPPGFPTLLAFLAGMARIRRRARP